MVRIRSFLCLVALAVVGFGCGKVQVNDSDAGDDPDASTNQCLPSETACGDQCFDTQSSHDHCGSCEKACGSAEVCDQGDCSTTCSGSLTACDGSCVNTDTSDMYCGSCTNSCTADQVCQSGTCDDLTDVATLTITSQWPEATGWLTPNSQPIEMKFAPVTVPNVVFECRTGPESIIGSLSFSNCDGGNGNGTTYQPSPVVNMEEGSYRTDVRLRRGTWTSDVQSYQYYAHHSLDAIEDCLHNFTDAQIFAKAASELNTAPTFDPATVVRRPYIHIPFKNITVNWGLRGGGGWSGFATGDAYDVDVLALRRRFALSSDNRLLLVQRVWESRMKRREWSVSSCANSYYFGHHRSRDCPYFVLNSRGEGVCLAPDAGNPGQLTNTRGPGNWFDDAWVKLARRDGFHKAFYGKRTTPCPAGGCEAWEIYLPE